MSAGAQQAKKEQGGARSRQYSVDEVHDFVKRLRSETRRRRAHLGFGGLRAGGFFVHFGRLRMFDTFLSMEAGAVKRGLTRLLLPFHFLLIHLTHLSAVQCGARAPSCFKGALDPEARRGSDQG